MHLVRTRVRLLTRSFSTSLYESPVRDATMVRWTVGGVTAMSADTDLSLTATFDGFKYHFNVPENFGRACIQHRRSLRKTNALFLTRIHTDTAMGLPGLLMSLADSGISNVAIVGPQGLGHFMNSTRTYAFRPNLQLNMTEAISSAEPCYKDQYLTVYGVPIIAQDAQPSSSKRKRNEDADTQPSKARKNGDGSRGPQRRAQGAVWCNVAARLGSPHDYESPENQGGARLYPPFVPPVLNTAIAYICIGPSVRGKFDAARATELGVIGKVRGLLTRGETVTLANGTVVTPDMCIGPSFPASTFFIVDCPSHAYIDGLVSSTAFARHRTDGELPVHAIYYRLGDGVLQDERFKAWMASFGPDVHHILASSDISPDPLTFTSQGSLLLKVSHLDSELLPLPKYNMDAKHPLSAVSNLPANVHVHDPYLETAMHPRGPPTIIPRIVEDTFHPQHVLGMDVVLDNDTAAAFDAAREATNAFRDLPAQPGDDVKIITLGTGSAVPSMYRNVLSNLVQIPNYGNILLDCGEGTFGQLVRRFGHEGVTDVLRSLGAIFISHNHGDHHMGLSRVLAKRRTLIPDAAPIYIIATRSTLAYLREYQHVEDIGIDSSVILIHSEDIRIDEHLGAQVPSNRPAKPGEHHYGRTVHSKQSTATLAAEMGFSSIETTFVIHRCSAYAIVLRHQDGWSIAFSGDTRPCDGLVKAGKDVTLLIHEASMADDQEEMAMNKGHSTFSQALDIGKRMNAKNVLLTHFSSRYPHLPVIAKGTGGDAGPVVGVAFDFISVTIGQMKRLQSYLPVLERTFAEELEDDIAAPGADSGKVHV